MRCSNCNYESEKNFKFCPSCGAMNATAENETANGMPGYTAGSGGPKTSLFKKAWFWLVIALIVILIAGIVILGSAFLKSDNENDTGETTAVSSELILEENTTAVSNSDEGFLPETQTTTSSTSSITVNNFSGGNYEYDNATTTPETIELSLTEKNILGDNQFELTYIDHEILDSYTENYAGYEKVEGQKYLFIKVKVKNTSSEEAHFAKDGYLEVVINDKYSFTSSVDIGVYDGNYFSTYYTLLPFAENVHYIIVPVAEELLDQTQKVTVVLGLGGDSWLSLERSDYIYNMNIYLSDEDGRNIS